MSFTNVTVRGGFAVEWVGGGNRHRRTTSRENEKEKVERIKRWSITGKQADWEELIAKRMRQGKGKGELREVKKVRSYYKF